MLNLVTGVPGAGKTCSTIKQVMDIQKAAPDRVVYYFDIAECTVPGWIELTADEVLDWRSLPQGSIIVVDEAYKVFPQRSAKVDVPESVQALAEHRHNGYDFFLITQAPTNLDVFARRLIGAHYHYDRRYGQQTVNRYLWHHVQEKPNDHFIKRSAMRESVKFDKAVYALYKSAEVHTHKRKYPAKLIAAVAFFVSIPLLAWGGYNLLSLPEGQQVKASDVVGTRSEDSQIGGAGRGFGAKPIRSTLDLYVPRIKGLPHTAPIYDEVTAPVTYPKYNCMHPSSRANQCKCYSQQATLLAVPVSLCLSIVNNGLFDHARPDAKIDTFTQGIGKERPKGALAPRPLPSTRKVILKSGDKRVVERKLRGDRFRSSSFPTRSST